MDFELTAQQRRWRDLARDFAQQVIRPRAEALDRAQQFPYDIIAQMAELGLMGLTLPPEYGGSGGDFVSYCLALEEISRADTSVAITMEAHISLGCAPIAAYGTAEQKERFLAPCVGGQRLWAFGLTEECAGSDAAGGADDCGVAGRPLGDQRLKAVHHELGHGHHRRREGGAQDRVARAGPGWPGPPGD